LIRKVQRQNPLPQILCPNDFNQCSPLECVVTVLSQRHFANPSTIPLDAGMKMGRGMAVMVCVDINAEKNRK